MEESAQQLSDFYDIAQENLTLLNCQINKIIEIKKKLSSDVNNVSMIAEIENLKKINEKLPEVISKIRDEGQQFLDSCDNCSACKI